MARNNNRGLELIHMARFLGQYANDPLGFVYAAFPWGEGILEGMSGPQDWQKDVLTKIKNGQMNLNEVTRIAVASGNGIGKSALVAWCILWAISTHEDTRGTVTANTEVQLRTKTWAELSKWYQLFIGKDLFVWAGTSIVSSQKGHEGTWRVDAIPWSATNPEAFAGLHNKGKRLFLIMDEASAIDSCIWEAAEGAMTDADTEILWLCFGNPTRNEGRFFDCFHRFRSIWDTRQIDSRTVEISNKKQLQQWVDTYGIDSDFVKVHILGQFPSASEYQFISMELAEQGRGKHLLPREYNFATKILAIDPAWTGGDATAIVFRQGLKATLLKLIPRNDNDMYVAQLLAMYEDKYGADAVFIDLGYGTGIFSAGKTMGRNWSAVLRKSRKPSASTKASVINTLRASWPSSFWRTTRTWSR